MRFFLRYFLFLLAALTALTFALPRIYHVPYPGHLGPRFDDAVRNRHIVVMNEKNARMALVGDSALEQSVDSQALTDAIGMPTHVISIPGSTSAFWYVAIKNLVLKTETPPPYVVIFFRDTILTVPNYHVNGGYVREIDEYATSDEEVLLKLAYLNFLNPFEKWALAWFPVYSQREQVTATADYYARNMLPFILQTCRRDCLERAHAVVYHVDNMQKNLRADVLVNEQDILYTRQAMNFKAHIDSSFLPEIIRLAKENGLHLIMVQERTLLYPTAESEPDALRKYKQDLAAYFAENDVTLLDFSYDPRIPVEFFEDAIHMNAVGKATFTQLLAEALIPRLP